MKLKVGYVVKLKDDIEILDKISLPVEYAGKEVTIININNQPTVPYRFFDETWGEWAFGNEQVDRIIWNKTLK
jgi:hypothetical protein